MTIALKLADLNDLPVKLADIQNSYIIAPVTENICTVLGKEFGDDAGRKSIVFYDLYSLKSIRDSFWNHLAYCMHHLVLLPYPANLDIWMKPMVRPDDGFNYYTDFLMYVDYVMIILHDAESVIRRI